MTNARDSQHPVVVRLRLTVAIGGRLHETMDEEVNLKGLN